MHGRTPLARHIRERHVGYGMLRIPYPTITLLRKEHLAFGFIANGIVALQNFGEGNR